MRYHREVKWRHGESLFGTDYACGHPLYDECTLFLVGTKGLAVIQQRFNRRSKTTVWGPIDAEIADDIYRNEGFANYFEEHAACPDQDGIYPTVVVREIMWALRMKPLPLYFWESRLIKHL